MEDELLYFAVHWETDEVLCTCWTREGLKRLMKEKGYDRSDYVIVASHMIWAED